MSPKRRIKRRIFILGLVALMGAGCGDATEPINVPNTPNTNSSASVEIRASEFNKPAQKGDGGAVKAPASFAPDTPAPIITSPAPGKAPVAAPVSSCDCPSGDLDCKDFDDQDAAQEVFDCCMEQYGYDKHRLDRDHDDVACEANR